MTLPYDGYIWLLLALGPLLYLQPRLQREVQVLFLLLTRRKDLSIILFSLIFLPGVILHELSHFVMAKVLFVRTGRVSVIPRQLPLGQLQMGYVEVAQADPIRMTLIGIAPLLAGSAVVAYVGLVQLGLLEAYLAIAVEGSAAALDALFALPGRPDAFVWLYLALAVSSTMFPSASDRRAWLPFLGIVLAALVVMWQLGAQTWLIPALAPGLNNACRAVSLVFALTAALHLLFLIPAVLLRRALTGLTGMRVA